MKDLSLISTEELVVDALAAIADAADCHRALLAGVEVYGKDKSVVERMSVNLKLLWAIQTELERREQAGNN